MGRDASADPVIRSREEREERQLLAYVGTPAGVRCRRNAAGRDGYGWEGSMVARCNAFIIVVPLARIPFPRPAT